jgi:hypothetical protein
VPRLSSYELHAASAAALGEKIVHVDDPYSPILTLELAQPLPERLRVYQFNATNSPGERSIPEHKIQPMASRLGRMRGARVWSWPEGAWQAERCAVGSLSCRG